MPTVVDLAVAWDWEYDREFLAVLVAASAECRRTIVSAGEAESEAFVRAIAAGRLRPRLLLDRASETSERFAELVSVASAAGIPIANEPSRTARANDKATMHLEFIHAGIHTPHSLIIAPEIEQPELRLLESELRALGSPFIVKPANETGGGEDVVLNATAVEHIVEIRRRRPASKVLVQERIVPARLGGRRAYFRCFWVYGRSWLTWWDDRTHDYRIMTLGEEREHALGALHSLIRRVHEVCGLNFFSTEVARTADGRLVAVDYVNDACDMRLQSNHDDGVPDAIVGEIAAHIVAAAAGSG